MEKVTVLEAERQFDAGGKSSKDWSSGVEEKIFESEEQTTMKTEEKSVNNKTQSTKQSGMKGNEQKSQQVAPDKLARQSSSSASMPHVEKRTSGKASDVKLDKRQKYRSQSLLGSSTTAAVQRSAKGVRNQSRPVSESLTDQFSRMHIRHAMSSWFV